MPETRIAIAGLGAIGRTVARRLAEGMPGLTLVCAASRDVDKAKAWLDKAKIACPLVELAEFPRYADLAVECAPAEILESICTPMLTAGKRVMVLSAGALLPRPHLLDLARQNGGEIIVPTGALLGLDAVAAAAEGVIRSVRMTTRKPPRGLAGAAYLVENGISVEGLNVAKCVFAGTAREAAAGGRHRSRPHHDRDMGRSRSDPKLPFHRGRFGFSPLFVLDRKHPVGKSQDRPDHGALRHRGAAQAQCSAAGGDVEAFSMS